MSSYQQQKLQQEIETFKKNMGIYDSPQQTQNPQQQTQQNLPQQSFFLQQHQYNSKPDKYEKKSDKDLEFRDDINEKVNNLKFSLPTQSKAQHFFDSSIVENNPQYLKINNDVSRRDGREGMNNRMDTLMFQQFQQPHQQQQSQQPHTQQHPPQQSPQQQPSQYNNPNQQENFITQLPNNFNNVFQQTNRVTNRDANNERMQTFTSLPRALHQPTQMVDARPMLSPYVSSYQDSYRPFSQNQSPNQTQNQNQYQTNNQANYETYYNPSILDNESLLRKNESGRNNYKDAHNTRLQELSPLSRTCALPATSKDYTKSIQQSNILFDDVKAFKRNDMENRQEVAEQRKQEWQRMSKNLIHVGAPPTLVVKNERPIDTRQM